MVRAESTNTCTAGVDTNHSTMFALLAELSVIYAQRRIQFELQITSAKLLPFKIHFHSANL